MKISGERLLLIALLAGLLIGAAVAWTLQGSRLRPRIKDIEQQARGLQHKADAWQAEAAMARHEADSIAAVVLQLQAAIPKEKDRYHEDVDRYRGAGPDSVRRVILWTNPH